MKEIERSSTDDLTQELKIKEIKAKIKTMKFINFTLVFVIIFIVSYILFQFYDILSQIFFINKINNILSSISTNLVNFFNETLSLIVETFLY